MRLIDADEFRKRVISIMKCVPLITNGSSREEYFDELLDSQPTIEQNQWIPCSEKLPEENDNVFITFVNNVGSHTAESTYKNNKFYYVAETDSGYYEEVFSAVIAWQSLPKPYKGEQL